MPRGTLEFLLHAQSSDTSTISTPSHDLVWAKMKGFGYWPAKVLQREDNQVDGFTHPAPIQCF
uniref:PWWP domain-containing protein n=1 Tax=Xiphophorus couchianus TaxID=32473 RepID=A0A3B5MSD1_9TELE